MNTEKKPRSKVWIVMLILSILLLIITIPMVTLSGGIDILENVLVYAGSNLDVESLDQATLGALEISMLKPLWEELWIGIIGIYCAFNLRKMKKHAWWLSFFWGIMMLTNATIQGLYEVVILRWSTACMQTYLFLFLGAVAVLSMVLSKKKYFSFQSKG